MSEPNNMMNKFQYIQREEEDDGIFKRENLKVLFNKFGTNNLEEDLETGLIYYMRNIVKKLRKISKESQCNEENHQLKYYTILEKDEDAEKSNANLIIIKDPLGDYKFAEKRDLEMEKFYENKIQKNREKEITKEEEEVKMRIDEIEKKKKKKINVDSEIFKMLSKMKLEKIKDLDNTTKFNEDQNKSIFNLIKGQNPQKINLPDFKKKDDYSSLKKKNSESAHISHKHLIHFLENDLNFRKSKYLLEAYMKK